MKLVRGLLIILVCISSGTIIYPEDYHYTTDFNKPVVCSPAGIQQFLTSTYNQLSYGSDFLPNNFCHLVQLLEYGKQTHQKKAFAKSVFRLFNNRLKSSSYINAYAFTELLEKMPDLLDDLFIVYKSSGFWESLKTSIYTLLYNSFKSDFDTFKSNPTNFLDTLSQEVVNTIQEKNIAETSEQELRKVLLVFLEMNLNKLVWSPEDGENTWESVKTIAQHLTQLVEHNIFDDPDDLNDLFLTLIERYCFFLDLTSTDLSLNFYEAVKNDIVNQPLLLLELEEQENYITPKKEILMRGIAHAQATALAYHHKPA